MMREGWSRLLQIQARAELADLVAKVEAGVRLSREDGYRLLRSNDLMTVGYMADLVRRRQSGDFAYFTAEPEQASDDRVCTVVYDGSHSVEELADRIIGVRERQERTGEILCAQVKAAALGTGMEEMRFLAVVRILLDNVRHVRCDVEAMGRKMAQSTLAFGVDDLGAVGEAEAKEMAYLVREAGRTPVQRDRQYNTVKTW